MFGVFAGFLKIIAPVMGFSHNFSSTGVGVSHFLSARGGDSPFQKNSPEVWSGLELTDT